MTAELSLVDRIVQVHLGLRAGGVPHAFGGALALAWCTRRARGTIDIDVNLFVPATDSALRAAALDALPNGIVPTVEQLVRLDRDGQTRLFWGATPVDVFFNTTPFHEEAALRARTESFAGQEVPFLSCADLAVFKAFFDRTKDWADLEEMYAAGSLDLTRVVGVLTLHLGPDDPRIPRLLSLRD